MHLCEFYFSEVAGKFFLYLLFMFLTFTYFTFYGMMAVGLTPSQHMAAIISSAFYSLWNLLSGFLIPKPVSEQILPERYNFLLQTEARSPSCHSHFQTFASDHQSRFFLCYFRTYQHGGSGSITSPLLLGLCGALSLLSLVMWRTQL